MQITDESISGRKVVFESILDEVSGGASLNVTRLDSLTAGKEYIAAGAPVYYVPSTRVAELCKTATIIDGGSTSAPRIQKNHHFKVNDIIGDGTTAQKITAIDSTTSEDYDTLTLNSTIAAAATAGTKMFEGTVTGSSAVLKYTPNGVVKDDVRIAEGNAAVSIVRIGTVREDALTYPLPDLFKTALRSATGTSLITVVSGT